MKLLFVHFSHFLSFRYKKSPRHIWTNKTTKLKWTLNSKIKITEKIKLLCCLLMGESQQSVATYPIQSCDLRPSCTYRRTDWQTDRQTDSVSHRTVPLGFASSYTGSDLGISRLGSTVCLQRWAPRSTVVFRFLSYFLVFPSFFVLCTFCFFFPLYLPIYSSFPFRLYSHIFLIFFFFPSVCVSLLPHSPSLPVTIFVCSL
jgi:hypothetical protein